MSINKKRRKMLTLAVGTLGGAGVVAVSAPFFLSLQPSPYKRPPHFDKRPPHFDKRPPHFDKRPPHFDIDVGGLNEGQMLTVSIRGKPLYILKRSPQILEALMQPDARLLDPESKLSQQPAQAQNAYRSIRPDLFVAWGMCTHLGCGISHYPPGKNKIFGEKDFQKGIWYCPCHGAKYDLAGRVYKHLPAQFNLGIPDYQLIDEATIRVHSY